MLFGNRCLGNHSWHQVFALQKRKKNPELSEFKLHIRKWKSKARGSISQSGHYQKRKKEREEGGREGEKEEENNKCWGQWQLFKTLKIELLHDPTNPLHSTYQRNEAGSQRDMCTLLFTVAKQWEQPRHSTAGECLNKM